MRAPVQIALLAAVVAASCFAIIQLRSPIDQDSAGSADAVQTATPSANFSALSTAPREADDAADDAPGTQEAALAAYFQKLSIRDDLAAFIDEAPRTRRSRAERQRRADNLLQQIRALEENDELVPVQSVFAQAAVLKALYADDPQRMRETIDALKVRYEQTRVAPSTAHLDERFQRYKAREREILNDVLSRATYLNGMSREDYLRERLNDARAEIYGEVED